jgi:type IV secretory pathway TrbD component
MEIAPPEAVPGFVVPVHRALTEHILLGGAPRGLAIANATLAAAIGLGLRLWIAGVVIFALATWSRSGRRGAIPSSSMSRGGICAFPPI